MSDIELINKLQNTTYFLEHVVLKNTEIEVTFKDRTVTSKILETALIIIGNRCYNITTNNNWIILNIERRK